MTDKTTKTKSVLIALGVAALLASAGATPTAASTAAYIKFDGVDGESKGMDHEGWIDLVAISQPLHKPGSGTGATRRRGGVVLEDITVTKTADKASPKLAEAVCKGKVFPKVEIQVAASADDPGGSTYYTYELRDVRVTSYSVTGGSSGDDRPTEQISLNFGEIKVSYAPPRTKAKQGNVETTWKVEEGE